MTLQTGAIPSLSAFRPPESFADVEELDDFLTTPSLPLVTELQKVPGDILILGAGGKMGPTLGRLARRAAPEKDVIAVSRFSNQSVRESLTRHGVQCISADLLNRETLEGLPRVENVIYLAGQKFGASADPAAAWAVNAGLPWMVSESLRADRIIALSTACVYPYVSVTGPGAVEETSLRPPPGDYAYSCVAREQVLRHGSIRRGFAGRLIRLSYAIDMRYGVLHDVAKSVLRRQPIDLTMGHVNVIWQGDANEQILRALHYATTPMTPLNVSGAEHVSVRWLANRFGDLLNQPPRLVGEEAADAWLVDTSQAQRLFGRPVVQLETMIKWVVDWVQRDLPSLELETHFQTRNGIY